MLCEKCGRRQAEWGTLCSECEQKHAEVDRKNDIVKTVTRLKWFALWMTAEVTLAAAVEIVLLCLLNGTVFWAALALVIVAVLCETIAVREFCLWCRYASRLQKGEHRQVADELLHRPKGFWRVELHRSFLNFRRRRSVIGTALYFLELSYLKQERLTLEAFLKDE